MAHRPQPVGFFRWLSSRAGVAPWPSQPPVRFFLFLSWVLFWLRKLPFGRQFLAGDFFSRSLIFSVGCWSSSACALSWQALVSCASFLFFLSGTFGLSVFSVFRWVTLFLSFAQPYQRGAKPGSSTKALKPASSVRLYSGFRPPTSRICPSID